jgi:hypothetical protein
LGILKHNRSEMVVVLGPFEALPYYIHTLGILVINPLLQLTGVRLIFGRNFLYIFCIKGKGILVTGREGP